MSDKGQDDHRMHFRTDDGGTILGSESIGEFGKRHEKDMPKVPDLNKVLTPINPQSQNKPDEMAFQPGTDQSKKLAEELKTALENQGK